MGHAQASPPVFLAAPGTPYSPLSPSKNARGRSALDLGFTRDRACLVRKSGKPDLRRRILVQSTCGVGASGETRAPFGAPSRRRYGAGPRFLTRRFALPPALRRLPLSGGRVFRASGKLDGPPSASSWQGILVSPGGAPAPPGSLGGCVHLPPAGAASGSII